ncbi:MAG: HXXEE domain-containing protein [Candidatus Acidiferrales bacterium]
MENVTSNRRLGMAWVIFALALAVHVTDEATHDFLSTYNSSVRTIRARLPFLPLPTFSFGVWLTLLIAGIILLLCLSPVAFRGSPWLQILSRPLGVLVGVLNACLHIGSSVYFHRWMPGVYSSPLLLLAAIYLLASPRGYDSDAS